MRAFDFKKAYWAARQTEPLPPDNEVWYWASEQVALYSSTGVVDHAFSNGKGVVTFNKAVTTLGMTFRGTPITNASLPDTTTSIGDYAFFGCSNLALTKLPRSVTYLGRGAFRECTSLALTSLPAGLTTSNNEVFSGCTNLALTVVPASIEEIGSSYFNACYRITQLEIHVKKVGLYACRSCTGLTEVVFGSELEMLTGYCFNACTNLSAVTFNSTPSIDTSPFTTCANLTDIYVPWSEGDVAGAPWGANNATIHYNHTP